MQDDSERTSDEPIHFVAHSPSLPDATSDDYRWQAPLADVADVANSVVSPIVLASEFTDELPEEVPGEPPEVSGSGRANAAQRTQRLPTRTRIRTTRVGVFADPLYDVIPVAQWVEDLLATSPFKRLAGVSLSNAPGDLLFEWRFPSRLEHSIGVYHLARLARPRDRAIQAAALAHDLGHGPFSHLTEPLMRERLGMGHEERSAQLLRQALEEIPRGAMRRLAWLDPDEVASLMTPAGADARGHLLNGMLDYDNIDNVARFLTSADLGELNYDPVALARALRLVAPGSVQTGYPQEIAGGASDGADAQSYESMAPVGPAEQGRNQAPQVMLLASAEDDALGWRVDRAKVYRFVEEDAPYATHEMLRKAVELSASVGLLPATFFDYTDDQALRYLEDFTTRESAWLVSQIRAGLLHRLFWLGQASLPADVNPDFRLPDDLLSAVLSDWRSRLALEARLAAEAGLLAHEVIVSLNISSGGRALPPLITTGQLRDLRDNSALRHLPKPPPPRRMVSVFVAHGAGRDYRWRLRGAIERTMGRLGVIVEAPQR